MGESVNPIDSLTKGRKNTQLSHLRS